MESLHEVEEQRRQQPVIVQSREANTLHSVEISNIHMKYGW